MATKKAVHQPLAAAPKNEVATRAAAPLVLVQDERPDYLAPGSSRGTEQVGISDIAIPRLEIVQGLSPALKPNDPGYIKGAVIGDLTNSVSRINHGQKVAVVPVYYTKQWLLWRDQKKGGGFAGAYDDGEAASNEMDQRNLKAEDGWMAIDTPQYLCLLLNKESGKIEEVMVSMPRTKAKVSRQWQGLIRLLEGDMFSRVYEIGTAEQKKDNNTFQNYTVKALGFPSKELFKQAEALYLRIRSGEKKVVMDTSHLDPEETPEEM